MNDEQFRAALMLYRKAKETVVPGPNAQPFEFMAAQNVLLSCILGRILGFPDGAGYDPEILAERLLAGQQLQIRYNPPTKKD